jgi:putative transcriptional regulator
MLLNSQPAKQIKDLRYRLEMTQEQFAVKLGVTTSSVCRWERGESQPSPLAIRIIELMINQLTADTLS